MTKLKFLFYISYVVLAVWFYRSIAKPWGISVLDKYFPETCEPASTVKRSEPATVTVPTPEPVAAPAPAPVVAANDELFTYAKSLFRNGAEDYEDSRMDDQSFAEYTTELARLLSDKFTKRQLQCIRRIKLINWDTMNDNVAGTTTGRNNGKDNTIKLSVLNDGYETALLHEVWHSIHYAYYSYFENTLRARWDEIPDFVSDYAETGFYEDVAETGRVFSSGEECNSLKIKLIKQFYDFTR